MWRRYLLTAVVVGLAGCAWTSESPQNPDRFESDPAERAYSRHIAAHRAQGAAADAMLLPRHFDGDQLNSLGRAKLTDIVMATADRHGPVVVYLYLPEPELTEPKYVAARDFMMAAGIAAERVALRAGPNPATDSLASLHSEKLYQNTEEKPGPLRAAPQSEENHGGTTLNMNVTQAK
jgi:hypothetical protein